MAKHKYSDLKEKLLYESAKKSFKIYYENIVKQPSNQEDNCVHDDDLDRSL